MMSSRMARGFLTLLLSSEQIDRLKQKENSLPVGRLLTASELSNLFGVKSGIKTPEELSQMEQLENEYHRLEWKRRKLEDLKEVKIFSDQEEMWEWDIYVSRNWSFNQVNNAY